MSIEIELKAWVADPQGLRNTLNTDLSLVSRAFEKEDTYWHSAPGIHTGSFPPSGIRIRKETTTDAQGTPTRKVLVTYKTKEVREGIEVNHEREFSISDGPLFEDLLRRFGFEPGIGKHKQGWTWDYEGITVELVRVSGLGWFVELEILEDEDLAEAVTAARTRLLDLLHRLGIDKDNIESRYYTELLACSSGDIPGLGA
ncbi:MAG: class IV adenylate cyclase [Treponema sp.]|jgi:adenylate cyclase class 2|nr:class IV adenylate cyclase [Treponema sp.]